jgi:putative transposase
VLETALGGEMDDHLGYGRHDPAGRDGGNSRNGYRAKTVLTGIGPVEIAVPRDLDASFNPQIVRKRQRRLSGMGDLAISLVAKGLTTGEVQAHLAEVYGAEVSRETISAITDRVLEGMADWQSRPLDPVYAVLFIDYINVKIRDGNVANRPVYVALAVTVDGERDVLGLWAGEGRRARRRRGRPLLAAGAHRDQKPRHAGRVHRGLRQAEGPARGDRPGLAGRDHPNCVVHLLRNSFRYASKRDWAAIARDLKPACTAASEAEALVEQPGAVPGIGPVCAQDHRRVG